MNKTKGAPKGRRPVVYICAAIIDNKLIQDEVWVNDQTPLDKGKGCYPIEIAKSSFKDNHGTDPQSIKGPHSRKLMNTASAVKSNKAKIVKNIKGVVFSDTNQIKAIFNGWRGNYHFIEDDDYEGVFFFIDKVDNSAVKKTPLPGKIDFAEITPQLIVNKNS